MSFDDFLAQLSPKLKKEYTKASEVEKIVYPTVSMGLNAALGGGFVAGRIATIYGPRSSGKSTIILQSIPIWQKMGLSIVYADLEGTYDKDWAARLGIDNEQLLITGSKSSEKLSNQLNGAIQADVDIIIIDSISAIMPANYIDKDGELKEADNRKQIGSSAKAIKLVIDTILYNNTKTAIILISQTTTDLSGMHPEQKPHGGKAVEFASTHMIKLNSSSAISQQVEEEIILPNGMTSKLPIARDVEVLVTKNKVGPAYRKAQYRLYYDGDFVGIDTIGELFEIAASSGVIVRAGSWFKFNDKQFQGKDAFVDELKQNDEYRLSLEKAIGNTEK